LPMRIRSCVSVIHVRSTRRLLNPTQSASSRAVPQEWRSKPCGSENAGSMWVAGCPRRLKRETRLHQVHEQTRPSVRAMTSSKADRWPFSLRSKVWRRANASS
jgi:hypothetical protein